MLSSGLPAIKGHIILLSCRQKDGKGLRVEGAILHLTRGTRADTSIILHAVIPNSQQALSTPSPADIKVCPTDTEMIKVTTARAAAPNFCAVSH